MGFQSNEWGGNGEVRGPAVGITVLHCLRIKMPLPPHADYNVLMLSPLR